MENRLAALEILHAFRQTDREGKANMHMFSL
jgi:hypothetical protein